MIVKSLTRKSPSFKQLIRYLHKRISVKTVPWIVGHNIEGSIYSIDDVTESFRKNDHFRKKRKNGVSMYHEILSLPPEIKNVCLASPSKFEHITREYIKSRSPNGIAYAIPHFYQNNNPHVHIVFSANELESGKSIRVSKKELEVIKKSVNKLEQEYFPRNHRKLSDKYNHLDM